MCDPLTGSLYYVWPYYKHIIPTGWNPVIMVNDTDFNGKKILLSLTHMPHRELGARACSKKRFELAKTVILNYLHYISWRACRTITKQSFIYTFPNLLTS